MAEGSLHSGILTDSLHAYDAVGNPEQYNRAAGVQKKNCTLGMASPFSERLYSH